MFEQKHEIGWSNLQSWKGSEDALEAGVAYYAK